MAQAAAGGSAATGLQAAAESARQVRAAGRLDTSGLRSPAARRWLAEYYDAWQTASGTTSHDAFLTEAALECMRKFSPTVLTVAMGEIDCAHYGSWSRYVDAIRRTDELTWRLWQATEELSAYRGRTLMLVLPDHGRQLEQPDGPGFVHHSDFYTGDGVDEGCRRVWMLALGLGVTPGRKIDRPTPITAAAAAGLQFLGLRASAGVAPSPMEM